MEEYQDKIKDISIDYLTPNNFNPRERFNEEEEKQVYIAFREVI